MSQEKTGHDGAHATAPYELSDEECGLVSGGALSLLSKSTASRTLYVAYTGGSNSGGAVEHSGFPTLGDMVSKTYFCA